MGSKEKKKKEPLPVGDPLPQDPDEKERGSLTTLEQENQAKNERENELFIIYIFVTVIISTAWTLGAWGCSFVWIFFLIVSTFIVWRGKLFNLIEAHIKYLELLLHRKRALRNNETAEWLNFVINRW